jgi:putative toxin-antitoxin system antitoxin component (TIGR02293 family)
MSLSSQSVARNVKSQTPSFQQWQVSVVTSNAGARIQLIRSGVNATVLVSASEYFNMPRAKFAQILGMSPVTAERKIKRGGRLGRSESERLARIAMIDTEAEAVFGNEDTAKAWLLQNNLALGDTPLSMLDTETGAHEIRKMLSSITYGGVI